MRLSHVNLSQSFQKLNFPFPRLRLAFLLTESVPPSNQTTAVGQQDRRLEISSKIELHLAAVDLSIFARCGETPCFGVFGDMIVNQRPRHFDTAGTLRFVVSRGKDCTEYLNKHHRSL